MEKKNLKTIKIRVKDNNLIPYLKEKIFTTRHFENILIILINQDYKQNEGNLFHLLTNHEVIRPLVTGNEGGKAKEGVDYLRAYYKDHQLMKDLIEIGKKLKSHNIVQTVKSLKGEFKGFFTKHKKGDLFARPPKTKKLSKSKNYTVELDSDKSFTLKKKNQIGLNLNDKMKYTHVNHNALQEIVGDLERIQSINVNYSNRNIYLNIAYYPQMKEIKEKPTKYASIDIGVNNLISLYVEDEQTPSLIVDGTPFKTYNASFNRFMAKLNEEISTMKDEKRKKYLSHYRSFLYEKRNNFFFSEFHKVSKRVLEFLEANEVTHLVVSKNLAELKNNGECQMWKKTKQNFIQIPFIELIKKIQDKAWKFGIQTKEVNEAWTSKTSSVSADVRLIQKMAENTYPSTNDLNGSRVKRGMFKDRIVNKILNADLNGARNINVLGMDEWIPLRGRYFKLCNPKKFKSDSEFCKFLRNRQVG